MDVSRVTMPARGYPGLQGRDESVRSPANRVHWLLKPAVFFNTWLRQHRRNPGSARQDEADTAEATQRPWVTIVWDDPVNLMNYVTYIFQKLFGYSEPHATKLMLQVHNEGKAVVSAGTRESMEVDVSKLHAAGLWATMQQDR